ncbi:toprim domain-containing protein [Fusobacterium polymorphum]|uniref:toprim domain-containing protein n=1 Tax=Fusobacterium nucleatum subsp. polymorphum TaxID=76857 RepID=UPI0021C3B3F5|nr:toprim domain-containing protein [Fusobacterium polymorphum]
MSKEKTYRVQEIFNWYKKFENTELRIKGTTKEFDIEIRDKYLPHLLGLQYINDVNSNIKGKRLYSYVKDNNLSDQEILDRIEQNYGPGKREDISNRIETFPDFLKNLENGIIVEKTLSTKMNVNYLIIQNKDDEFYHLGILSGSNGALLVDFENVEDKREKDLLKTYFVESNKEYFKGSNIAEIVKSIEKYDEKEKEYVPFSFDDEKNKSLLKKYYSDKKEKAKEFLEEYLQRKGINTKELFRCISPNHEDKNPSMSFYAKKNKCTCFACGKNYDIFDLVKMEYGLKTFPEQLRKVEEFMKNPDLIEDINKTIYSKKNISIELGNNIEKNKSISNKKSVLDPNNPNDIERIIKYQNYIKYCMSNLKECDYLTKRGISEKIQKEYHIGYDPNFKYASFNKAIIIPTYYGCLTARNIDDSSKDRLRKLGNAQIFHYDRIKENPGKEFYIVEGEIDALSIAEAGKKAIALGSVNEINLLVNKLKEDKFENKFILMLDNDEIGKKTQEMLYTKLKEIGINVEKSDILGKYKDPNEFLMKDREKFLSLFQEKEKENPWKKN